MDTIQDNSLEKVYLRLKAYLNKLEEIIAEIVEELEANRKERSEWFEWHKDWKNAWLCTNQDGGQDLQLEEFENLRLKTSVQRKNTLFDLKKEVSEMKNELETIRNDREKLLLFLENPANMLSTSLKENMMQACKSN